MEANEDTKSKTNFSKFQCFNVFLKSSTLLWLVWIKNKNVNYSNSSLLTKIKKNVCKIQLGQMPHTTVPMVAHGMSVNVNFIILTYQQGPSNGGLNDVTRIQTATASFTICTGCLGIEVVATDVQYCTKSYTQNNAISCKKPFGPCPGATVYRYTRLRTKKSVSM